MHNYHLWSHDVEPFLMIVVIDRRIFVARGKRQLSHARHDLLSGVHPEQAIPLENRTVIEPGRIREVRYRDGTDVVSLRFDDASGQPAFIDFPAKNVEEAE